MASGSHMFSSPVVGRYDASLILVSSSPDFPSICDMIATTAKNPPLRSGSRAGPILETGFRSFTTASTLWRSNLYNLENDSPFQSVSGVTDPTRALRTKPLSPSTVVDQSETLVANEVECAVNAPKETEVPNPKAKRVYKPRAKRTVSSEGAAEPEAPPKSKPRRKAKEKDASTGQTTLPKGKVTKAAAAKLKQTGRQVETVSKHFAQPAPVAAKPIEIHDLNDPIELEPALARRIDWTPTRDTAAAFVILDSSTLEEAGAFQPSATSSTWQPRKDLFTNLHDTYGCVDEEDVRKALQPLGEPVDTLGKRKLLEMVTIGGSSTPEVSPTKPKAKAVKKKPRTITELATAAYRVPETDDDIMNRDESLLSYFSVEQEAVPGEDGTKKAASGKSNATKAGTKPKPKRATKKKPEVPKQILLSPTSALQQVSRQDFVFGTSSQLATEEDAGLLRDLQLAMKASNRREEADVFLTSPVNSKAASKLATRRLWAAGARDVDGDLLQVEVVDLVDDLDVPEDLTNPTVTLSLVEPPKAAPVVEKQSVVSTTPSAPVTVNAMAILDSITCQAPVQPTSPQVATQNKAPAASVPMTINSLTSALPPAPSVSLPDFFSDWDDEPPASNQEHFQLIASQAVKSPPKRINPPTKLAQSQMISDTATMPVAVTRKASVPKMPDFEKWDDERVAREISKFGFKPVKRRAPAIALLVQCWMSKNKSKLEEASLARGTAAFISTTATTAAKVTKAAASPKPRGRPKKDASAVSAQTDDHAAPAKKPRGRPKKDATTSTAATAKPAVKRTAKAASFPQASERVEDAAASPSTPKRRKKSPALDAIEIADSDDEDMDPLSPLSSPEPANESSSPPQLDVSMTTEDDSLTLTPTDDQAASFKYITDAVKTAPRTADPENPSWHEKMLMYDPVVLEDLTAWLNAGQLDRVGWDEEVSPADVRKWCESKSVCCVWKVTNNGKDRARF